MTPLLWVMVMILLYESFVATSDECSEWYETCSQFQMTMSRTKFCIGKTLFFFPNFMTNWHSARSYCSGVFHGYRRADLLYYDEELYPDPDLELLLENYHPQNAEFPTAALCCPIIQDEPIVVYDVQCKWLYNGHIIPKEYYRNVQFANSHQCHFLMVDLSDAEKPRFSRSIQVSNPQVTQFMCSYKRPPKCGDATTTTTQSTETTRSSTTTTTTITPSTTTTTLSPLHCPEKHQYDIYWPSTNINHTAQADCPANYKGHATWLCGPDGKFVSQGPNINCTAAWIDESAKKIEKVNNMKQLSQEVRHFQNKVQQERAKYFQDLKQIVKVIRQIEFIFESFASNSKLESTSHDVRSITESMVESCATIVGCEHVWQQSQQRRNDRILVAGEILNYIQDSGLTMGCYQAKNESASHMEPILSTNNTYIYVNAFNMNREQPIQFDHFDHEFSLKNLLAAKDNVSDWCPHSMAVGALFKKLSTYMFDEHLQPDMVMNSEIIAFSYNNFSRQTFPLPDDNEAIMRLVHHQRMDFGMQPKCVFWNFETNLWSSRGCHVATEQSDRLKTTCVCDHLTNFAVLMDVSGQERPSKLKSILTIIMCALSIICLILTVVFFMICRELKSRRNSIIINISIIMIIIDLLVIFGLDRTEYPILCKSVSISLLYTMLALFFWMLMEGYNLYQMMIFIFNTKGHLRMLYLYLIGYGAPLLITVPASIYMHFKTELSNEYFCWITSTKYPGQIWFLAGPVTLIIVINTFIMVRVMKIVLSKNARNSFIHQSSTSTSNGKKSSNGHFATNIAQHHSAKQRKHSHKNGIVLNGKVDNDVMSFEQKMSEWLTYLRGFFGLAILMGITWISYVLYIHQFGHFFSYVFIVTNGLQGVFIFLTQFIFNRKAMDAVKKRIFTIIGAGDFSSAARNATTTSYLSQQRVSKPSLATINKTNPQQTNSRSQDDDDDDPDIDLSPDKYPYNVLIDRTTSFEF
ncbi:hypothetical protein DERF_000818 [Dermatophagoides farinae]|uniref:7 transmembrane receptor -like protein n=1 Tax=Dermatophagoides farinae TaxID=6954 RepID=A0A922I869_DERFA|nr:7 transmembrane receptor -like protein [Dermatophagoides farinae]KAH9526756.1 hypothetical protein DERF_000818 [Dermatophagoides farinae]